MMIDYESGAKELLKLLNSSQIIYISSHVSVDGDNLGSVTAMYQMLKNMGKDVYALKSDVIPNSYSFIPYINELEETCERTLEADLYITLDTADIDRLGANKKYFECAKKKIVIDHHGTNVGYGDANLIYSTISSTCEILTELFLELGIEIDKNIATSLLTGLSTDTGRFLYSNTTPRTFQLANILLSSGADMDKINLNLYQSRPFKKVRLLKVGLDNMKMDLDNKLAYTTISQDDLKYTGAELYDLDEIIDFIRDTEGVLVAFIIKEVDINQYKVSLRSKGDFDVSKIAKEFGGGGHINASGMSYYGNISELKSKLIERIKNVI